MPLEWQESVHRGDRIQAQENGITVVMKTGRQRRSLKEEETACRSVSLLAQICALGAASRPSLESCSHKDGLCSWKLCAGGNHCTCRVPYYSEFYNFYVLSLFLALPSHGLLSPGWNWFCWMFPGEPNQGENKDIDHPMGQKGRNGHEWYHGSLLRLYTRAQPKYLFPISSTTMKR